MDCFGLFGLLVIVRVGRNGLMKDVRVDLKVSTPIETGLKTPGNS